ncbi:MAG: sulfotransferase family protein [Methylococcales symbiont of Hymedesmia sp. n. MRB-2018]|nr:MAG: sulfotransferase family protein [Methylococcales symbiont of Hymedesmia sp. n. MRB-2018]
MKNKKLALSPLFLMKNLPYLDCHWSEKNKYLAVLVPKSACSSLKVMIMNNEGIAIGVGWGINKPFAQKATNLGKLPIKKSSYILNSKETEALRWCSVRNPYARLVSAWRDKIAIHTAEFNSNVEQILGMNPEIDINKHIVPFEAFVHFVVNTQNKQKCDGHWRPMVNLLYPEIIDYHLIIKVEEFKQGLQTLKQKIKSTSGRDFNISLGHRNKTVSNWKNLYDKELAALVYDFYKEDFLHFNYEKDSWKIAKNEHIPVCEQEEEYLLWVRKKHISVEKLLHKNLGTFGKTIKLLKAIKKRISEVISATKP